MSPPELTIDMRDDSQDGPVIAPSEPLPPGMEWIYRITCAEKVRSYLWMYLYISCSKVWSIPFFLVFLSFWLVGDFFFRNTVLEKYFFSKIGERKCICVVSSRLLYCTVRVLRVILKKKICLFFPWNHFAPLHLTWLSCGYSGDQMSSHPYMYLHRKIHKRDKTYNLSCNVGIRILCNCALILFYSQRILDLNCTTERLHIISRTGFGP